MKNIPALLLVITTCLLFSCSSDDNDTSSNNNNQTNNPEVFNELIGNWIIQSSEVGGEAVDEDSFNCLKTSIAEFTSSEYVLNYRKKGTSLCSITQEFSGTYSLNNDGSISLDSIGDNLSAILKDGKLIITSTEGEIIRIDIFINEKDIVSSASERPIEDKEETETTKESASPEVDLNAEAFKALTLKLNGNWNFKSYVINKNTLNISNCGMQNTLNINKDGIITLTQNNTTFTKGDLLQYGVSIGSSQNIQNLQFSSSFGNGDNTDKVTIDSNADCKLIKESKRALSYINENEARISPKTTLKWIDKNTIELHFENLNTNTVGVITYSKEV